MASWQFFDGSQYMPSLSLTNLTLGYCVLCNKLIIGKNLYIFMQECYNFHKQVERGLLWKKKT